jgi:hypothetical protein
LISPIDSRTIDPLGILTEPLEDLLQPFHLTLRLVKVVAQAGGELSVGRLID